MTFIAWVSAVVSLLAMWAVLDNKLSLPIRAEIGLSLVSFAALCVAERLFNGRQPDRLVLGVMVAGLLFIVWAMVCKRRRAT